MQWRGRKRPRHCHIIEGAVKRYWYYAAFAVGWSLLFLLTTTAIQAGPKISLMMGAVTGATFFTSVFFGREAAAAFVRMFRNFLGNLTFGSDVGAFWGVAVGVFFAFVFQVIMRYTAAPSGADSVLLLSTAPVFALILGALRYEKVGWGRVIGIVAALLGSMMIVANWERPSSFAPFAVFPKEETFLLLSAFGLASFALAGKRLVRKYTPTSVVTIAFWFVLPFTAIVWLLAGGPRTFFSTSGGYWAMSTVIGIALLALPLIWLLDAVKELPATRVLTAVSIMPVLVTLLIGVERGFGFAYLPVPFYWAPIIVGIIISIMGVTAAWLT